MAETKDHQKFILWSLAGVVAFLLVALAFVKTANNEPIIPAYLQKSEEVHTVVIGDSEIVVELADTGKKKRRGLSGRESLADRVGMLFVFDDAITSFWMKDMLIPIDIVWINDGVITKIDAEVPPPPAGTADERLRLYNSEGPVDYVLEVASGYAATHGIGVGDTVDLSGIE